MSADHRVKVKEGETPDKYQDSARELKKPWNMTVAVILIVPEVLGTAPKNLKKKLEGLEIRGRIETGRNTALKSARIH